MHFVKSQQDMAYAYVNVCMLMFIMLELFPQYLSIMPEKQALIMHCQHWKREVAYLFKKRFLPSQFDDTPAELS